MLYTSLRLDGAKGKEKGEELEWLGGGCVEKARCVMFVVKSGLERTILYAKKSQRCGKTVSSVEVFGYALVVMDTHFGPTHLHPKFYFTYITRASHT